MIIQYNTPVT